MCGAEEDYAHAVAASSKVAVFQVEVRGIILFKTVPHISSIWHPRLSKFLFGGQMAPSSLARRGLVGNLSLHSLNAFIFRVSTTQNLNQTSHVSSISINRYPKRWVISSLSVPIPNTEYSFVPIKWHPAEYISQKTHIRDPATAMTSATKVYYFFKNKTVDYGCSIENFKTVLFFF